MHEHQGHKSSLRVSLGILSGEIWLLSAKEKPEYFFFSPPAPDRYVQDSLQLHGRWPAACITWQVMWTVILHGQHCQCTPSLHAWTDHSTTLLEDDEMLSGEVLFKTGGRFGQLVFLFRMRSAFKDSRNFTVITHISPLYNKAVEPIKYQHLRK